MLRIQINASRRAQGASGAVRESILRRSAFRDRKTDIARKIGADTEPFSHSLGPEHHSLRCRNSVAIGSIADATDACSNLRARPKAELAAVSTLLHLVGVLGLTI